MSERSGPPTSPRADAAAEAGAEVEGLSFEQALARLEALVAQLEQGDLELEEALSAFERGVALARRCSGRLEEAERRVEILVREGGRLLARPFEEPEDEA